MAISTENETTGAQAGLMTAIAIDSLAPINMPAASAPSGLPRRPMMTTAKTTPSHAHIWAGARVAISAMKVPAMPVPVLVLNGDLDANTAAAWGRQAARQFPHATFIEVKGAGHTPTSTPQGIALILDFIAHPHR